MGKELEFLFQASDQRRWRNGSASWTRRSRSYQKGGQAEAAAAMVPFLSGRRFGRSGKAQVEVIADTAGRRHLHQWINTMVQVSFLKFFHFLINRNGYFIKYFQFSYDLIFLYRYS